MSDILLQLYARNLRVYLHQDLAEHISDIVANLGSLKHLAYFWEDASISSTTRDVASRLFASHSQLAKIEMWNETANFVITKGKTGQPLIAEIPWTDELYMEPGPEQWRVW